MKIFNIYAFSAELNKKYMTFLAAYDDVIIKENPEFFEIYQKLKELQEKAKEENSSIDVEEIKKMEQDLVSNLRNTNMDIPKEIVYKHLVITKEDLDKFFMEDDFKEKI